MRTGLVPIISQINKLIMDEEHRSPKDTPVILALEQCKRYAMMARALKQARESEIKISSLEEVR